MRNFIQSTILATLTLAPLSSAIADTEMLLPLSPALTPDGSSVIFSWEGDLWMKSTDPNDKNPAKRITYHPGEELKPIVSNDGKTLYFNSTRNGAMQIYKMDLTTLGTPQQLTFHSSSSTLSDLSDDESTLYYTSFRDDAGRAPYRIYSQDISQKSPEHQLFNATGKSGKASPDGSQILFTREGVDPYRKGYIGSQSAQIWLYHTSSKNFSQPVADSAGCMEPIWLPDGSGFYYLCGKGGVYNIWKHDFSSKKNTQLTHEIEDSLLFPTLSADGSTLLFRKLFHHYTLDIKSGNISKLDYHHNLELDLEEESKNVIFKRCSDADFSPSGLEIVLSVNGDLFAMDTVLREPHQLTQSTARETNTFFGDKGKAIYFIHDDGIKTTIKKITKKDASQYWWKADETVITSVISSDDTLKTFAPSPNEKLIAYTTVTGKLFVYDLAKKSSTLMATSWEAPGFDWSPDSKWLTYSYSDNNFNSDIFLAPIDGSQPPVNITKHPDNEMAPAFSPDGNKIAFIGKRQGSSYDVYYVDLTPTGKDKPAQLKKREAAIKAMKNDPSYKSPTSKLKKVLKKLMAKPTPKSAKKKQPQEPKKVVPAAKLPAKATPAKPVVPAKPAKPTKPTKPVAPAIPAKPATPEAKAKPSKPAAAPNPASAKKKVVKKKTVKKKPRYALKDIQKRIVRIPLRGLSPGGLFWAKNSRSIYMITSRSTYSIDINSKKATKFMSTGGTPIRYDKRGNLYWISNGLPTIIRGNKPSSYAFTGQTQYSKSVSQRHTFRIIWRTMRDGFYDSTLNGKNWDAIRVKYEDAAAQAKSSQAFDRIISLLLGELNASHCGFTNARPTTPWRKKVSWLETMRHLGVKYSKQADGWHITTVLPNGPADKEVTKLKVGDIITAIDGTKVNDQTIERDILWGQMKDLLTLDIKSADAETDSRQVTISPISYAVARKMMQGFTINRNKDMVEKLSHGRLGYIHISRMMWDEFVKFEQHLYENGAGKDGIVIDVRNNGGGFTTDHLLTALTQPRHAFTVPRNGGKGYPQDRFVYATWNKPIVILCNQNSFSNAEIFAHAIRTLKRGQIVGVTTAGGVISAGSKNILSAGKLRMPFRGWFNVKTGEDQELNGAKPHHVIWPKPGELTAGIDKQLEKAVEVLSHEVTQKKAARRAVKPHYHNRK